MSERDDGAMEGQAGIVSPLHASLFSDFSCPASWILEETLRRTSDSRVRIRYRAYELYPAPLPLPVPEFRPADWSELRRLATQSDLELEQPRFRPRTRKAHEAARFARDHGREDAMRGAMFAAYWRDGTDIGRIDRLVTLAEEVGLSGDELKIALDIDRYEPEVAADEDLARRLRVVGSPVLYLGTGPSARIVVGARPAPEILDLIQQAITIAENGNNG